MIITTIKILITILIVITEAVVVIDNNNKNTRNRYISLQWIYKHNLIGILIMITTVMATKQ